MQRMTNRNAEEAKLGRPRVMTRRLVSLASVAALGTVGFLAAGSLAGGATATNATVSLHTTKRSNGSLQVIYNKHPLYTYSLDKQAGQTNGEGVSAFGARWYAVSARGTAVLKASPPPPPPATTGTGTTNTGYGNG